jgi:ferritin-like metal-binding protein YciE
LTQAGQEVTRQYLDDIVIAETLFEQQLREFSKLGDDDEVQVLLAEHAEATRQQRERLAIRMAEIGGRVSSRKVGLASILNFTPQLVSGGSIVEEQTLQNLLIAYTVETGEFAMYEALSTLAHAAGDTDTEQLAKQIQSEKRNSAERIWHFLPSRSKIAFNMLTVSEIDPAVETKMADDRLIEG